MKKIWIRIKGTFNKIKNSFVSFSRRIKKSLTDGPLFRIKTLAEIQIKNKKKLNIQKTIKQKYLIYLLCLAIIVGLCFFFKLLVFVFESYVLLKGIPPMGGDPIFFKYLIFILAIYLIVSVIEISVKLVGNLYKAQDNSILLVYPVKPGEIFISKLAVVYIREFKKALFVVLPFLVGFFMQKWRYYSLNYTYFFGAFFVFLFIPIFLTLLSGVLSLLFSFIDTFFKRYPFTKFIVAVLFTIGVFTLLIIGLNALPNNLKLMDLWAKIVDNVSAFVSMIDPYFITSNSIGTILRGKNGGDIAIAFAILFGLLTLFTLLIIFVCYRYFFKAAGSAKEISSGIKRKSKDKQVKNIFLAFFRKELKLFFRSEDGFMSTIVFVIVLPLLIFSINKIFGIMYISTVGKKLIFSVNVLLCITVLTASNITASNALSREASEFYLLKISPINAKYVCYAKILIHFLLNIISLIAVGLSLKFSSSANANTHDIFKNWDIVMVVLVSLFVITGHLLWSFELDLTHPKVKLYMAGEKDTSNLTKSLFIGLGLGILFTVIMALFLFVFPDSKYSFKEMPEFNYKWISILIFAVLFLVTRIILFVKRLNTKFEDITY